MGPCRCWKPAPSTGSARVLALHCDPRVDAGSVAVRDGPISAATDLVIVRLSGPGGHTARPQLTVDIVAALADVVVRTPALLSRRVDPRAALSLVWGEMAAGSASNVIPQSGEAAGSLRTLDLSAWKAAETLVPDLIREIAEPYHAEVEVDYVQGVPPAVNDTAATVAFRASAATVLGPDRSSKPSRAWGRGLRLDAGPGSRCPRPARGAPSGTAEAPDIHRGDFDVDEAAIDCGSGSWSPPPSTPCTPSRPLGRAGGRGPMRTGQAAAALPRNKPGSPPTAAGSQEPGRQDGTLTPSRLFWAIPYRDQPLP